MKNEWLAIRLCTGHPAAMSQLVSRLRKDPKALKIQKKHEKISGSKASPPFNEPVAKMRVLLSNGHQPAR